MKGQKYTNKVDQSGQNSMLNFSSRGHETQNNKTKVVAFHLRNLQLEHFKLTFEYRLKLFVALRSKRAHSQCLFLSLAARSEESAKTFLT